jgi:hypothetical protein
VGGQKGKREKGKEGKAPLIDSASSESRLSLELPPAAEGVEGAEGRGVLCRISGECVGGSRGVMLG